MKIISISEPKDIPQILDVIHDCWFDLDNLSVDNETKTLSINFKKEVYPQKPLSWKNIFRPKTEPKIENWVLKVNGVQDCVVDDTEKIGRYDFNNIEYNEDTKVLSIKTGVPLKIDLTVDSFNVVLEQTQ